MVDSVRTLLALWPSIEDVAADLRVNVSRVAKWVQRGTIPSEYWADLVASARRRRIAGVSAELLTALHAREPMRVRA